jgi:hypothetical protein
MGREKRERIVALPGDFLGAADKPHEREERGAVQDDERAGERADPAGDPESGSLPSGLFTCS